MQDIDARFLINAHHNVATFYPPSARECLSLKMPPKKRRERQLAEAREAKRAKRDSIGSGSTAGHDNSAETLPEPDSTASSDPSEVSASESSTDDPTSGASHGGPPESVSDEPDGAEFFPEEAIHMYANEWIESLHRDSLQSVSVLLWHLLGGVLHYPVMDCTQWIGEG